MTEPLVVRVPTLKAAWTAVANAAIAGWGIYEAVRWDSLLQGLGGLVLVAITGPLAVVVAVLLARNQTVLVITDDGLEVPKFGAVAWSEIQSLEVDGNRFDVKSRRGEAELPLGRMNVTAKRLRDEIAARSGGSWSMGQWTNRVS